MTVTPKAIRAFLDEEGRIAQLPVKHASRRAVLGYLAQKFEAGRDYSEKEVNALCDSWHTFGDYFVLRRGLVDEGFLHRLANGTRYWREQAENGDENQGGVS